ncbi:MAG TPA: trigger factor [Ktedonobacteraceae bacterium]|nr:trigger factor [Ktedonobacteraceae bacterium]
MKVTVETLPSSEAVLEVDLSWDELEKASDKAYRKLVQQVNVPGFRRGKAPRTLLERRLGKEAIYQEALDDLITETYRNTLKEHQITPLKQPELEAPVFEMGQPYHFTIKVPIITPVELGDYASLHFDRAEADVTSEEVEKELEALRNRRATWNEVERPAAIGDRVVSDLKLTVGDKVVSDLKDNTFELTDDRSGLFTGMDEQIAGMSAGESKEFTTTLPEDYAKEDMAGKEGHYSVTVHKVEEKNVPELEDSLAGELSNGEYETLEDLRKGISDEILSSKQRRIRDELREQALQAVIDQSTITLHPLLVQEEVDNMLHQFSHMLEQQRMSMDQYLMMMRKTEDEYKKDLEPDAENRVKRELVLDALANQENITVEPEELEALFRAYQQAGQPLQQTEAQVRSLFVSYRREKALTRLIELTTDPDPDAELEAEAEAEVADEATGVANASEAARVGELLAAETAEATEVEAEAAQAAEEDTAAEALEATDSRETPEAAEAPTTAATNEETANSVE